MRADNNWEDSVGKRLFDMEGDLSPQSWENISRRIAPKPKRKPLWYWLPALLLFLALPVAFYKGAFRSEKSPEAPVTQEKKATGNLAVTGKRPEIAEPEKPGSITEIRETTATQPNLPTEITNPENPEQVAAEILKKSGSVNRTKGRNPALKVLPGTGINDEKETEKDNRPENKSESQITETARTTGKNKTGRPALRAAAVAAARNKKPVKNAMANPEKTSARKIAAIKTKAENPSVVQAEPFIAQSGKENKASEISRQTKAGSGGQNEDKADKVKEVSATETSPVVPITGSGTIASTPENNAVKTVTPEEKAHELAATQTRVIKADSSLLAAAAQTDSAQRSEDPELPKPKTGGVWGIYATPQYTFQRVFANVNDEVMILGMLNKNSLETERLGYEFGFRKYIPVREKVQLEVGLQFARINHHIKFRTASTLADSVTVTQQNGNITLGIRNREQTEILLFKYFFGGLYTGANVRMGNGWKLSAGVGANWLLWKNPDEEKVPIPTRSLNPYISAGLTYQMPVNREMVFQAGPSLQYFISPVQKETAHYGAKPTVVGFTLGLLFQAEK